MRLLCELNVTFENRNTSFPIKLCISVVVLRDKFFAFFVVSSNPGLPSNGICTRANYPGPPLKLRQNLLRRRIEEEERGGEGGLPARPPPVLPVQQPGMPSSAAELVFKRRPRLGRVATLRAPRPRAFSFPFPSTPSPIRAHPLSSDIPIPLSASRWNVNSPSPLSPPASSPSAPLCPACLAHSDSTERGPASGAMAEERARGRTGEPVRESRYGARDGDGLIRDAVEKIERERARETAGGT